MGECTFGFKRHKNCKVFPRRLTNGGGGVIFNNRLLFPYCFLKIFVGQTRP